MKRLICLFLTLICLLALPGCGEEAEPSVSFYYLRSEYVYGAADGVICPEARDIPLQDIEYLLDLYLDGPQSEELVSPFPVGTQLLDVQMKDGTLLLEFSKEYAALEDMDLTLSAGCIASTCFSLTDAQAVRITASALRDKVSITLARDSLSLIDDSAVNTEAAEPTG